MVSVEKRWPGETVAILGCGPSLMPDDVHLCRGKVRVIAVNTSWEMAPWADVLYSSDIPWWRQYDGVPQFQGLKYALSGQPAKHLVKHPEIQILANTGHDGLELKPHGLRTIHNSGGAAINLAVHLGAARILLLGYDMSRRGKKTHWFGDHPVPLRNHSPYPMFLSSFATMVKPLRAAGITVINCSRETELRAFPRMALHDALQMAVAA